MPFYAHSLKDKSQEHWEPLFTPFGNGEGDCQRNSCQKCEQMDPKHGHLNKVAFWAAKFAAEMFPLGQDHDTAHHWGYFTGLWHDLGKFAPEWQTYLASKSDPHAAEITGSGGAHLVC